MSVSRNGLVIEIADVPAVDAGVVAMELLKVLRALVAAGYDELVVDAGSVTGGVIELVDEADGDDFVLPPEARRIGFVK